MIIDLHYLFPHNFSIISQLYLSNWDSKEGIHDKSSPTEKSLK